jgi:DNA-binding CsgD family transcriptional regulator
MITEDKEKIVFLYKNGKSVIDIANDFGISDRTIVSYLKDVGVFIPVTHKVDEITKDKICEEYISGKSSEEIGEKYGITGAGVLYILKCRGIQRRDNSECQRKLNLNEEVFDEFTEESLYWLGFLTADGSLSGNQILLRLTVKDKDHLEKFKKFLGSDAEVKEYIAKGFNKEYPAAKFVVNSKKMANRLRDLGFVKDRKNVYPDWLNELSDDQFRHWLRGLWDGDGTVGIKSGNYGANYYPYVSLCGYLELLKPAIERLISILGVRRNMFLLKGNNKKIVSIDWEGNDAEKVRDYLYGNAAVFMDRKSDGLI